MTAPKLKIANLATSHSLNMLAKSDLPIWGEKFNAKSRILVLSAGRDSVILCSFTFKLNHYQLDRRPDRQTHRQTETPGQIIAMATSNIISEIRLLKLFFNGQFYPPIVIRHCHSNVPIKTSV